MNIAKFHFPSHILLKPTITKPTKSFKFTLIITLLLLLIFVTFFYFYKNQSESLMGVLISGFSIILAIKIYYLGEASQANLHNLSEDIQSFAMMNYKNQNMQLLLDNYLKPSNNKAEISYWYYRFCFENYETLYINVDNCKLKINILGTNRAPFSAPTESIITFLYLIDIVESENNSLPLGLAYCSYLNGQNKISKSCNKLEVLDPMYSFEIFSPGISHSFWISDKPCFYKRLKNTNQRRPIIVLNSFKHNSNGNI